FKQLFEQVRSIPIPQGGLFVDKSDLYQIEGQYNLSEFTKSVADILVGGNFKRYVLNSEGTLFADTAGNINIDEIGAYLQAGRNFLDDRLRLTVAGRYDKNTSFEGKFTPRATALIKLKNNNNIRLSYQTAYRFPSIQQQWINLNVGGGTRLLVGDPSFRDFYNFYDNPVYYAEILQNQDTAILYDYVNYKPESVSTIEVGYKGLMMQDKLMFDVYGYYG